MSLIKIHLDDIMFQLKKLIKKKKVAIGFYGITRSLKYTIDSIKTNIFDVFTKNNIDYDVFLHTYFLNNYSNKRAKETIITDIDNNEYKLLNPKYFNQDDQDKIKKKIQLELYRTKKDPWNTDYESVNFFILGCYSRSILTEMIEKTNINYDYILFVRPDCLYLDKLDISKLNLINNNTILISNFHLFGKYKINDRFAITNNSTYKIYGKVFKELLELSKNHELHSETIIGLILNNNKIKNIKINFNFSRIRINGKTSDIFPNYKNILEKYR